MRFRPTRRRFLVAGTGTVAALATARCSIPWILRPSEPAGPLSADAQALVARAFAGLDRSAVVDVHAHLVGNQLGGNGCWVHPKMRSHFHPISRLQFDAYLAATGVTSWDEVDGPYLDRLLALRRDANPAGRIVLLAFDLVHDRHGEAVHDRSVFYVPDAYAYAVADSNADVLAGASIHPYRLDAVDRVHEAADRGAALVKWLPSAMGIDPADPACDPFYDALAARDLTLLSHAGAELAVRGGAHDDGNPLRLRRALDRGVRVVVAHAASTGSHPDLDAAGRDPVARPAFDLCMRLLDDPAYDRRVFADLSAITTINRCGRPLRTLLERTDVHDRLVDGTDYPICAIGPLVSTWWLKRLGYLDRDEARVCGELVDRNPLLGDFVVKRTIRWNGSRFRGAVFSAPDWITAVS